MVKCPYYVEDSEKKRSAFYKQYINEIRTYCPYTIGVTEAQTTMAMIKAEKQKIELDKKKQRLEEIKKNPYFITNLKHPSPKVDSWTPREDQKLFRCVDNGIYVPIHEFYKEDDPNHPINFFNLKAKRCYNGEKVREHIVHYINYFEEYYDKDHSLFLYYARLKYLIDYAPNYTKENLYDDIFKYIFNPVMLNRIKLMVERNYNLTLNNGKRTNNASLQYTDLHAIILLNISVMQKLTIPLITHFISENKFELSEINDVLMQFYYRIFAMFHSVNMIAKLYETVISSVKRSMKKHKLWATQSIRGINATTHAIESVENIPLQLCPKYTFSQHIISFNFSAVRKNISFKVLEISYGYKFIPLSSSQRDDDNNSKTDKYEATLEKTDEDTHIYLKANKKSTMDALIYNSGLGAFSRAEIEFYKRELMRDNKTIINKFQQELVNLALSKYFGDNVSSGFTNKDEYVMMMIAVKRLLGASLVVLPEIIGGKVVRLVERKMVNKKEMEKLQASPTWKRVKALYRNSDIEQRIMGYIAIIFSSEFQFISYEDRELNGKKIEIQPEVVGEEFLQFILMCACNEDGKYVEDIYDDSTDSGDFEVRDSYNPFIDVRYDKYHNVEYEKFFTNQY